VYNLCDDVCQKGAFEDASEASRERGQVAARDEGNLGAAELLIINKESTSTVSRRVRLYFILVKKKPAFFMKLV